MLGREGQSLTASTFKKFYQCVSAVQINGETEEKPEDWDQMFRTAIDLSDAGAHVCAQVVPDALHSEAYWEKRIPQFMDYLLG